VLTGTNYNILLFNLNIAFWTEKSTS